MSRYLLTIICLLLIGDFSECQTLTDFKEIVNNEDLSKLNQFIEEWEEETIQKLTNLKKEHQEFYSIYEQFVSFAYSGKVQNHTELKQRNSHKI